MKDNNNKTTTISFEEVLTRLLKETGLYETRALWANAIGVSSAEVARWTNGETIPRPEWLWAIVYALLSMEEPPKEALASFEKVAIMNPRQVSKHGLLCLPNLGSYILRPKKNRLDEMLAGLTPGSQLFVLEEAMKSCREFRDGDRDQMSLMEATKKKEIDPHKNA